MRLLIELGADPLLPNFNNTTPLLAAAGVGTGEPQEEAGGNGRKLCQRPVKPQVRVSRDGGYADFVGRYRRDIKLAVASPMKFHAVRPRGNAIVAAEREALLVMNVFVKPGPLAHSGMRAVRADNPERAHQVCPQPYTIRMQSGHNSLPEEMDSSRSGPVDHKAMQFRPAYAQAVPGGKTGVDLHSGTEKADTAERIGLFRWNGNAKIGQSA